MLYNVTTERRIHIFSDDHKGKNFRLPNDFFDDMCNEDYYVGIKYLGGKRIRFTFYTAEYCNNRIRKIISIEPVTFSFMENDLFDVEDYHEFCIAVSRQ